MATNVKATTAFSAMEALGISEERVRPVLRNLLQLYDKNWELIEEENYRVLIDAIFEYQENKVEETNRKGESQLQEGSQLKRICLERDHVSPSGCNYSSLMGETSSQRPKSDSNLPKTSPKEEMAERSSKSSPELCLRKKRNLRQEMTEPPQLNLRGRRDEPKPIPPKTHFSGKGRESISPLQTCTRQETSEISHLHLRDNRSGSDSASLPSNHRAKQNEPIPPQVASKKKRAVSGRTSQGVCFKKAEVEPDIMKFPSHRQYDALIKPKSEPFSDDVPQFEVPLAVIHPTNSYPARNKDPVSKGGYSIRDDSTSKADDLESMSSQETDGKDGDAISITGCKTSKTFELANIAEASLANFEIASSPLGEVKISLSCNSSIVRPDFHMPSLDAVLKKVEDRCVKLYKIIDPNFSLGKLMEELCQCFLELGTKSSNDKRENFINVMPSVDLLRKSNMHNVLGAKVDNQPNFHMSTSSLNGSRSFHYSPGLDGLHHIVQANQEVLGQSSGQREKKKDVKGSQSSNSRSLVVVQQHQFALDDVRPLHNVNDISKGEERVKISLVNEINNETYPPLFHYIPQNMVYQNAYINFALARIGDEDCCANCFGDCMSSPIPCACARETRGDFAYTLEGLVKKELLDECISMSCDPQKHSLYYCKDCPLERSKNGDVSDPCKGHLVRKFIKECWSKCGCNKQCGNRVVQRGITCNLQVFMTPEGKGWGLRTLENLPRGTFVCEYVGEIVTNTELYERNIRSTGNEKHTYPVLLDADWGSEGVLKDEEALCLDATFYGNVARFINHRCSDANLVEIPVEVETPDHHYYHLAFFTTRNVYALEELTWDYGIDFSDLNHPIKAFRCQCGSKSCRDSTRVNHFN